MYVRNERDISKNKNEITNLNLRLAAGNLATDSDEAKESIVSALSKEERNFILNKKEKSAINEPVKDTSELLKSVQSLIDKAKK